MTENEKRPSINEIELLKLAYNRFYDLYEEIMAEEFWTNNDYFRFSKIKDVFSVYAEVLNYPPISSVLEYIKTHRPPMEAEIGSEFFSFIRNLVVHFPFFTRWEDIWVNKLIVNWYKEGLSIDKFLIEYQGHPPIKYRFWEADKKKMTYLEINFPIQYSNAEKVYLKDILTEKDGVKFSLILMKQILDTQVDTD
jgi:hypothetical protein